MLSPKSVRLSGPIAAAHENIFAFLLRVNEERHINATLRVAGGWVRDTLLGLHSQDIDIAIQSNETNHVSGEQFAREVSSFQESLGLAARTVSVIRVNPELSKHIETATVCVHDTPVEFCALRHDDYTLNPNSRIPIVRPATPLEDALRRDYTVNALFYNLHTREVEDYTSGLDDMDRRLLRCPLNPRETFTDDPLRLLRGVRFVGQLHSLGFTLDETILHSVDDSLLENITLKVSRERIGKELVKMLSGGAPEKCVELLLCLGVMQRVLLAELYLPPQKKGRATSKLERIDHIGTDTSAVECLAEMNRTVAPLLSREESPLRVHASEERLESMLFLLLLPFYRGGGREEVMERLYALCVNGLKLSVSTFHTLRRMMDAYNVLLRHESHLWSCVAANNISHELKLTLFECMCELGDAKVMPSALRLVLAAYVLLEEHTETIRSGNVAEATVIVSKVWTLLEGEPGLIGAATRALPLRGDELAKLVPLAARQIGSALIALRRHVMLHPNATRDEMIEWLRTMREEL